MDAIEFLIQQHLEIESLFDQFESVSNRGGKTKLRLCWKMGDLLAAHAVIAESIFYPAARGARTDELLTHALEQHASVKRMAADLLELEQVDEEVEAMMAALRSRTRRGAEEEERELFPRAREVLAPEGLEELGRLMEKMADELLDGASPRKQIPNEAEHPPRTSQCTCASAGRSRGIA